MALPLQRYRTPHQTGLGYRRVASVRASCEGNPLSRASTKAIASRVPLQRRVNTSQRRALLENDNACSSKVHCGGSRLPWIRTEALLSRFTLVWLGFHLRKGDISTQSKPCLRLKANHSKQNHAGRAEETKGVAVVLVTALSTLLPLSRAQHQSRCRTLGV
jgi:hypothetical protein